MVCSPEAGTTRGRWTVRGIYRSLGCIVLTACAARQAAPNDSSTRGNSGYSSTEVILRTTSWEDPELAARGLGRLEVVVHVADRPALIVNSANVQVKSSGAGNTSKYVLTNPQGVVRFDTIAVGRYELTIRAIGYGVGKVEATVSPGCRTDVEVYIGIFAIGVSPPPTEPSRVRVTTCRVAR